MPATPCCSLKITGQTGNLTAGAFTAGLLWQHLCRAGGTKMLVQEFPANVYSVRQISQPACRSALTSRSFLPMALNKAVPLKQNCNLQARNATELAYSVENKALTTRLLPISTCWNRYGAFCMCRIAPKRNMSSQLLEFHWPAK